MQRFALFVILELVACSRSSPPPKPPANTAPEPVTATAVEEEEAEETDSECTRYHELFARLDACPQLSEEDRQQLVQQDTDMLASRSESGMDGSSPYDTERGCEEGTAFLLRVAAKPCGWPPARPRSSSSIRMGSRSSARASSGASSAARLVVMRDVAHAYRRLAHDHPNAFPLLATRRFAR